MQKVIIIGAGPAGLTAADKLLDEKEKYDVTILEETFEIGGISKTVKYNGNRMDIGGHRLFSKDQEVMKYWEELMPVQGENSFDDEELKREKKLNIGGPNPNIEDEVMLLRTRVSRIYFLKKFFDYPVSLKWKTLKNMGLIRTIKVGFSYINAVVFKRKENSLEDFYINRFGKELYEMFFKNYTERLWGRKASEISADWGAQRVKGVSIKAIIKDMFNKVFGRKNKENTETSLIEQFWYPKFGPGQLWETLAKRVENKGGKILKGYKVKNINIENGKIISVECEVTKKDIENEDLISQIKKETITIDGDIFISSMPVKDLVCGLNGENIPESMLEIAKGLPYRDFMTVGLLVNKLNLKNETNIKTLGNIVPDCWIYVHEPEAKLLRIQIFNNWSPYMLKDPRNTVWIGLEYTCNEGDSYWNMSDSEFIEVAANELIKMGIIEKNNILDSHREKVKKAYPAYFDTYSRMDELIRYLDSFENLYCIGRHGQHRYNNMDHSMVTAFEAVKNIKNGTKDKSNIWNVNTEKEYHEEKNKNVRKRTGHNEWDQIPKKNRSQWVK